MSSTNWDELNRLFDQVITKPHEDRNAFLEQVCQDEALRIQVETLVRAYEDADDILHPLDQLVETKTQTLFQPGERIGHYTILREIGRGGMGQVYLARDTKLDRLVALKFLPAHVNPLLQLEERFLNEARAASALDHPNLCTIYEINQHKGRLFIAMAYYEGETLKEKILKGPLSRSQCLHFATQLADGLVSTHSKGIIHRDIKPANIIITPDDRLVLLDFGLAKVFEESQQHTIEGTTIGTLAYMSPEQTRGEPVTASTDLWSVGVVLYEMLAGQRPFRGANNAILMEAIRHETPPPIRHWRPKVSSQVERLIENLLSKKATDRHNATALLERLRGIQAQPLASTRPRSMANRPVLLAGLFVFILLLILFFKPLIEDFQEAKARASLPEIERLAGMGNFNEAFMLAQEAERHLGDDPSLNALWPVIADFISIQTEPSGAFVTAQPFNTDIERASLPPVTLGTTPIVGHRVARGSYKIRIEKEAYAVAEQMISRHLFDPNIHVQRTLSPLDVVPEGMVYVPAGTYQLRGQDRLATDPVALGDYAIDRFEVSNKEFKAFVDAGGYHEPAYWQHPFIKEGRVLSREEGFALLTDRTGLPGPRYWTNQTYSERDANLPVTGVTWYEASAYAAWAGKRLPTVYEWQRAARPDTIHPMGILMPWGALLPNEPVDRRANFNAANLVPVNEHPFGISPFGAYNMAGNVSEWCANPIGEGYVTAGGSRADPEYSFVYLGKQDGFFATPQLGFRCAHKLSDDASDQGLKAFPVNPVIPEYAPVDESTFRSFLSHYKYDALPLDPQLIETQDTSYWTRETIHFNGAKGERLIAYLYLPNQTAPPYQTILFSPPFPVLAGWYSIRQEAERTLAPFIKTGRAVLAIVPDGGLERPKEGGLQLPPTGSVKMREMGATWATEFSRGLDYLESRKDIDLERIAHIAYSAGGSGLIFPALEERYHTILLVSSGIPTEITQRLPEANSVNFVPYYKAPVLMINGRFDEIYAIDTHVRPLFTLLPHPKRLEILESGHVPPLEMSIPIMREWLDETLGPVRMD